MSGSALRIVVEKIYLPEVDKSTCFDIFIGSSSVSLRKRRDVEVCHLFVMLAFHWFCGAVVGR